MNTLVIYAHPNPNSFNAAIKETVQQTLTAKGHDVRVRDLYELRFHPVLSSEDFVQFSQHQIPDDIRIEQEHIAWADHIIFIYPTWWAGTPAILKGFIDRVFTNGFAFQYTENGAEGLLKNKKAIIFQTTGQPKEFLELGNLPSAFQAVMNAGTLAFTGMEVLDHTVFYSVPYVSDEERKQMLEEVKQKVSCLA
ncbi:flavodoxin family protein [Anoxybacillus flavithermus]|uniref:Flavodoxin family protein n=1 Tax=Anoxybacillus flavithermus TaxID=33934 RepID=A0A2G5RU86_9BACL|nr:MULTISPECIES: NAD(P)H-dependent oxidoreductase [Anoxybacillus]KFZ42248.1 NAD(P)H dehydrogenase [Anoxybacillus sp. KU2-6(11)]PIC06297.1 flavodoxin family protein [Anoxybacillus flavithermus]